jgi:hypothetical protein
MRTTVRLDEALLRAAKIKAAKEGRTLTSLLEDGLRQVLLGEVSRTSGVGEPRAEYTSEVKDMTARDFIASLPRLSGPALEDDPEYLRLAEKAGSMLPSRALAVIDEEEDLDRLLRPDTTAP